MNKKDISILFVDRTLGEQRTEDDGSLEEEIDLLKRCGYNIFTAKYSDSLDTKYDIIVAHPGWGYEAFRFKEFHTIHPKIPMIVHTYTSYFKAKFSEGYFLDGDGIILRGIDPELKYFLALIKSISRNIRKRNK